MSEVLRVIAGGMQTTVQDLGRETARRYGVPVGGAMDRFALQAANSLVGNSPDAAGLEIVLGGAIFEVLRPVLLAVTGADLGATLNNVPLPLWTGLVAQRGDRIAVSGRRAGFGGRAYLALGGGIAVPQMLGSRSTHVPSGFGGLEGRALRAGDIISAYGVAGGHADLVGQIWPLHARPPYAPEPVLRCIPGPHATCFADDALATLAATPLRLSQNANRMGYRLEGIWLEYARPCSLTSLGVIPGVIQVPPDGRPILLMVDAQTTGGYPVIGVMIAPDLPLAAQLLPGDSLRLKPISLEEALAARRICAAWSTVDLELDETPRQLGLAGALG